jgi:hypothetical protein
MVWADRVAAKAGATAAAATHTPWRHARLMLMSECRTHNSNARGYGHVSTYCSFVWYVVRTGVGYVAEIVNVTVAE